MLDWVNSESGNMTIPTNKKNVIQMDRKIFEKYNGKYVQITIEPTNLMIKGTIKEVFEECIQFKTQQKTSYLSFEKISSLMEVD